MPSSANIYFVQNYSQKIILHFNFYLQNLFIVVCKIHTHIVERCCYHIGQPKWSTWNGHWIEQNFTSEFNYISPVNSTFVCLHFQPEITLISNGEIKLAMEVMCLLGICCPICFFISFNSEVSSRIDAYLWFFDFFLATYS